MSVCPVCGGTNIQWDPERGEKCCTACGTVVRVRAPAQTTRRGQGGADLGTQIGSGAGQAGAKLRRIDSRHRQAKSRTLRSAKHYLEVFDRKVHLPEPLTKEALAIFQDSKKNGFKKRLSTEIRILACVTAAGDRLQFPYQYRLMRELRKRKDYTPIMRTYKALKRKLGIEGPEINSIKSLHPVFESIKPRPQLQVRLRAIEILKQTTDEMAYTARIPEGIAAAALRIASLELGNVITFKELSHAAALREATVIDTTKLLKKTLEKTGKTKTSKTQA